MCRAEFRSIEEVTLPEDQFRSENAAWCFGACHRVTAIEGCLGCLELSPHVVVVWGYRQDRRTLPGQRRYLGRGAASQTVETSAKGGRVLHSNTFAVAKEWNQQDGRFFWPSCGKFVFRGTRTHLQNSYFIVSVLTGKPPAFLADNAMLSSIVWPACVPAVPTS